MTITIIYGYKCEPRIWKTSTKKPWDENNDANDEYVDNNDANNEYVDNNDHAEKNSDGNDYNHDGNSIDNNINTN